MESSNKCLKLIRLYCLGMLNSMKLTRQILDVLKEIPAEQWWGQIIGMPDNIQQDAMFFICGKPKLSQQETKEFIQKIEENYNSTIASDKGFRSYFHNSFTFVILNCLSPDSSLFKFFKNRGKERPGQKDCWAFTCFNVWYKIQELIYLYVINDNGEVAFLEGVLKDILEATNNGENPNDILEAFKEWALPIVEKAREFWDQDSMMMTEEQLVLTENFISVTDKPIEQIISYNDETFDSHVEDAAYAISQIYYDRLHQYVWLLNHLFILLNTCFLVESKKKRIVEMLKESDARKLIQTQYESFRSDYPDRARIYVFEETVQREIFGKDINWNIPTNPVCFNLDWNIHKVNALYGFLLNEYIAGDTDIRDFYHILTGRQTISRREPAKINWIHKEKQSLALFIGKIIEEDTRRKSLKIPMQANLFLHNRQEVKFHSTTEYFAADKSEKFERLKAAINEAKSLVLSENEIKCIVEE